MKEKELLLIMDYVQGRLDEQHFRALLVGLKQVDRTSVQIDSRAQTNMLKSLLKPKFNEN